MWKEEFYSVVVQSKIKPSFFVCFFGPQCFRSGYKNVAIYVRKKKIPKTKINMVERDFINLFEKDFIKDMTKKKWQYMTLWSGWCMAN